HPRRQQQPGVGAACLAPAAPESGQAAFHARLESHPAAMAAGVHRDVAILGDDGAVARTARLQPGAQSGGPRGPLEEPGPRPAARVDPGEYEMPGVASLPRPEEERGRAVAEQDGGRRELHERDAKRRTAHATTRPPDVIVACIRPRTRRAATTSASCGV